MLMQSRTVYHWLSRRDDRAITLLNPGDCGNPDTLRLSAHSYPVTAGGLAC
uniref:Uncharacterized protein n=1 Tax=Salmonella enterica subsp. salamae TaxID=59202 RepID=I3W465_SALER|nr:hypothetical protein [Salmonella enterica subsp. salamae]